MVDSKQATAVWLSQSALPTHLRAVLVVLGTGATSEVIAATLPHKASPEPRVRLLIPTKDQVDPGHDNAL